MPLNATPRRHRRHLSNRTPRPKPTMSRTSTSPTLPRFKQDPFEHPNLLLLRSIMGSFDPKLKPERYLLRLLLPILILLPLFLLTSYMPVLHVPVDVHVPEPAVAPQTKLSHAQVVREVAKWKDAAYAKDRLRIYYYDLPEEYNIGLVAESYRNPPRIRDKFCDKSFYSAEHSFAQFLRNSPIRTYNASEADYFYVPILSTCYRMLNRPFDPVKNGAWFAKAMQIVKNEYPYWNRSDGRDHIFMFAQGAGARLAGDYWEQIRTATFLVHNGDYAESHFDAHKDLVVPPDLRHQHITPLALRPNSPPRKLYFIQFGGQILNTTISDHRGSNYSGGVRQYIDRNLRGKEGYRITGVFTKSYGDDMMRSKFCLAPTGWHKWTPRPAYAILLGCVPVVISERQVQFLENLIDYGRVSIWIRPRDVEGLEDKLKGVTNKVYYRMRMGMNEVWPLLWYGENGLAEQAILYSLWRKLPATRSERIYL